MSASGRKDLPTESSVQHHAYHGAFYMRVIACFKTLHVVCLHVLKSCYDMHKRIGVR